MRMRRLQVQLPPTSHLRPDQPATTHPPVGVEAEGLLFKVPPGLLEIKLNHVPPCAVGAALRKRAVDPDGGPEQQNASCLHRC